MVKEATKVRFDNQQLKSVEQILKNYPDVKFPEFLRRLTAFFLRLDPPTQAAILEEQAVFAAHGMNENLKYVVSYLSRRTESEQDAAIRAMLNGAEAAVNQDKEDE